MAKSLMFSFSEIWFLWTPLFTSILAFVRLSIVPLYLPVSRIGGLFPRFGDSGDGAVNSVWQFRSFGSLQQASLNICTVREKGLVKQRVEQNVEYGHIKGGARVNVYLFEAGKGDRLTRVLLSWTDGPTQHLRCKLKSSTATLHYTT